MAMTELHTTEQETVNVEGWEDLISLLDDGKGVCVVTMEQLRDIDGYGRLGGTVRAGIAKKLASMGIGTFAGENLPSDASANVVLFRLGTPAAELVNVIQSATSDNSWRNRAAYTAECMRRLNTVPEPEEVSGRILTALKTLGEAARATGVDPTTV
jgi:hypothetical protein